MPFQIFDFEKSEKFCYFLFPHPKFCTSSFKCLCTFLQLLYHSHQIILPWLYLAMTLHILFVNLPHVFSSLVLATFVTKNILYIQNVHVCCWGIYISIHANSVVFYFIYFILPYSTPNFTMEHLQINSYDFESLFGENKWIFS